MPRTITKAVVELCLAFPETEQVESHGSPSFKVAGKTFATFTVNHHGDGRVALNVASPPGAQQLYTEMEPDHYFVPPYVGPKGWLGIELNNGIGWVTVINRVREAWEYLAPAPVSAVLDSVPAVKAPAVAMKPEEINPLLKPRARKVLDKLRALCERYPETTETLQFGNPTWKAGKKTYVTTHHHNDSLCLMFWVGAQRQNLLTHDPRYRIPVYMGHNGWIELDVQKTVQWAEVENLLDESYRHFALKRMLKALDDR